MRVFPVFRNRVFPAQEGCVTTGKYFGQIKGVSGRKLKRPE